MERLLYIFHFLQIQTVRRMIWDYIIIRYIADIIFNVDSCQFFQMQPNSNQVWLNLVLSLLEFQDENFYFCIVLVCVRIRVYIKVYLQTRFVLNFEFQW